MAAQDFMPLEGWDHVELWVGNAKQAAYFYERALGFTRVAYGGPETGIRDRASYVLEQGEIRLVLTSGLRSDSEIVSFVARHGDAAKDVALQVPDAAAAFREAVARGATGVAEPRRVEDEHGSVELATVATYGDNVHTFVTRGDYGGPYLPGFVSLAPNGDRDPGVGLVAIDHVVGNVELGRMDRWVEFYERVFGMVNIIHFGDDQIQTEYSALMSKVMAGGDGKIKFPINEPAEGKRKSHIAFLDTPEAYYDEVEGRVGEISEDYGDLKRLRILADRDDDGYLLQIFTKTAQDRPTLFFEVIERHGATTFGEGNFKALFESIEREQALRGNL
jgi:4-hydroxyphenylpyruvate dioxygenase